MGKNRLNQIFFIFYPPVYRHTPIIEKSNIFSHGAIWGKSPGSNWRVCEHALNTIWKTPLHKGCAACIICRPSPYLSTGAAGGLARAASVYYMKKYEPRGQGRRYRRNLGSISRRTIAGKLPVISANESLVTIAKARSFYNSQRDYAWLWN